MKEKTTIGAVCKAVAIVILVIGIIGASILAMPSDYYRDREFNFGLFCGVSAGISLFCLQLYALGEIVDYLSSIHKCGAEISQQLYKMHQHKVPSSPSATGVNNPTPVQTTAQSAAQPTAHAKATQDGYIVCSACGCKQSAGRTVCWECSARFEP